MLIVLSGLPGVGKTSIARELARSIGAVHVRIDTIEQALRDSGVVQGAMNDAGYCVGNAVAEDNLRLGRIVIADSVNPIQISRDAWRSVARRASSPILEVEIQCSDAIEHRRRVETRTGDIDGVRVPTWSEVIAREYAPWDREHLVLDSATRTVEQNVETTVEVVRIALPIG
jgi:predicted kinase